MSNSKPDETGVSPDVDMRSSHDGIDANVNEKRRRLAKFAVGAPVLVTLASRPVFAGQCLSNMMSGNLSPGHVNGKCSTGWSPGGWGEPGGTVHTYSTVGAWSAVNLAYGTYQSSCGFENKYDCYTGGATLASVPGGLNKDGMPNTTLLRAVLCIDPDAHQLTRHLVCAYLNALLGALLGSSFHYVLTPQQVLDLASGATSYPSSFASLQSFLGSTWT